MPLNILRPIKGFEMGLGIYIKGEVSKPFLSFRKRRFELSRIQSYLEDTCSGLFRDFLSFHMNENSLHVELHPCEETVSFELLSDGAITCCAKTNSVGPGYHAYLVELLDKIGKDLGINWTPKTEEGEEYLDETRYFVQRDYGRLQIEMLRWLKALSHNVSQEDGQNQRMITMPMGFPRMKRDYFAMSPVQLWEREWFEVVSTGESEDLAWAGLDFFIWWNKEPDAVFYKQSGIALLNAECPWHFPQDDKEKKLLSNIDRCFELARKLDPSIKLPEEDWEAIKDFLAEKDTHIPETVYGYRKHLMTFDLADNWFIDLPGTMHQATDENTMIFYDHERNVRSLAYGIKKEKSDAEYAESFFDNNENINAGTEIIYSENELAGKAIIYYALDSETNSEYWILQGVKVANDKFLLSTISYPTEEHKDWAIQTWNSVRI